jgi:phosphopantetheinyl transferase
MPLFKTISLPDTSLVLIWKVTETYQELFDTVTLTEESEFRLQSMKSASHQKGFLAVRKLLQTAGYTDFDMFYETTGKPNLLDDHYISVTHSFDFAAIIISEKKCGIDIEKKRDKIIQIADKFISETEANFVSSDIKNEVELLTIIWCVKESLYKLVGLPGVSFKQNIEVLPFKTNQNKVTATVEITDKTLSFTTYFEPVETFLLAYAIF